MPPPCVIHGAGRACHGEEEGWVSSHKRHGRLDEEDEMIKYDSPLRAPLMELADMIDVGEAAGRLSPTNETSVTMRRLR
jgi:hypothetical protein